MSRDLVEIAQEIAAILGPDDCMLVGGLAVGAHGYVRATVDVDLVTRLPLVEAQQRLQARAIESTLRRGDPLEGDFPCLTAWREGVRVDVMPPLAKIEWDEALELRTPERLRVVPLEGLLRLKFRAGGPKDLMDAAALVLRHPDMTPRARALAAEYRQTSSFDGWLADPRLRADVEQIVEAESRWGSDARDTRKQRERRGARRR